MFFIKRYNLYSAEFSSAYWSGPPQQSHYLMWPLGEMNCPPLVYKLLVEFEQQLIFKMSRVNPGSLCIEQQSSTGEESLAGGRGREASIEFKAFSRSILTETQARYPPNSPLTFWTSLRKINPLHLMNVVQLAPASNIRSRCCLT